MKKFLSILLTLTMIFGLLAVVPASATDTTEYVLNYTNDYSVAKRGMATSPDTYAKVDGVGVDGGAGGQLTSPASRGTDASILLQDSTGATLKPTMPAGSILKLTMDLKLDAALDNNIVMLQIRATPSGGTLQYYESSGQAKSTFNKDTTEWQKVEITVEFPVETVVSEGIKLRFGDLSNGANYVASNASADRIYYLDNIVLQGYVPETTEPEPEPEEPVVPDTPDDEEEIQIAETLLSYENDYSVSLRGMAQTSGDSYTRDATYGVDSGYGGKLAPLSTTQFPGILLQAAGTGATLKPTMKAGSILKFSMDLKLENALNTGNIMLLMHSASDGYYETLGQALGTFDPTNTTTWQTVEITVNFPEEFVFDEGLKIRFGNSSSGNAATDSSKTPVYYLDNISVLCYVPATETITGTTLTATAADGATVVSADAIENATLIWVAYDANDKMLSHATAACNVTAGGTATVPVPQTFSATGAAKVKVMLWQDMTKCVPLADSVQY